MQQRNRRSRVIVAAAAFAAAVTAGAAFADKPDGVGGGRPDKHQQKDRHGGDERRGGHEARERRGDDGSDHRVLRDGGGPRAGVHFAERQRTVVREYFGREFRAGHCPPGLAKKGNGCMPPGQAKKWSVGRPLPREVVYYDLPPAVVVEIGLPPAGHRYVRVATDILLIAVGTGMVIDAIEDLGGL
jgi:Ni/Co efflux regulator RcnB